MFRKLGQLGQIPSFSYLSPSFIRERACPKTGLKVGAGLAQLGQKKKVKTVGQGAALPPILISQPPPNFKEKDASPEDGL